MSPIGKHGSAGEIAKDYGTVSFPLLDNPHFPSKNRWIKQVKALIKRISTGGRYLSLAWLHSLASFV